MGLDLRPGHARGRCCFDDADDPVDILGPQGLDVMREDLAGGSRRGRFHRCSFLGSCRHARDGEVLDAAGKASVVSVRDPVVDGVVDGLVGDVKPARPGSPSSAASQEKPAHTRS